MNTTNSESDNNLKSAENYYNALLAKDFDKMASYLHNDVHFIGPLAEMHGKEAVVSAAKNFGGILQDIQIRSRFSSGNQIMFAYNITMLYSKVSLEVSELKIKNQCLNFGRTISWNRYSNPIAISDYASSSSDINVGYK